MSLCLVIVVFLMAFFFNTKQVDQGPIHSFEFATQLFLFVFQSGFCPKDMDRLYCLTKTIQYLSPSIPPSLPLPTCFKKLPNMVETAWHEKKGWSIQKVCIGDMSFNVKLPLFNKETRTIRHENIHRLFTHMSTEDFNIFRMFNFLSKLNNSKKIQLWFQEVTLQSWSNGWQKTILLNYNTSIYICNNDIRNILFSNNLSIVIKLLPIRQAAVIHNRI